MKKNQFLKIMTTLCLTGVFALGMVGCGSKTPENAPVSSETPAAEKTEAPATDLQNVTSSTLDSTLDKDTLIIGLDDTFAPLGFRDTNGELTGFDVEVAKAIGEKLGKEITFQPIDWSMKETELNAGNIDLIWNGYTITEERKEKVSFSKPYLKNTQAIVTLADSTIATKADLAGKKVGAQNESSAIDAMEAEPEVYASFESGEAYTYEDNNQALMDLEAGRIDAVVADEILLRYYLSLKGAEKYNVLTENFGDEEYGVGMRKDDQKMVDAFNKAYDELKAEGTLAEISTKWFASDITQ
ncbi:amino acid ABC transporter substrate-binding protein [Sporanaerobium hydrogeniformans]|uniref:Amino acid ABC transporter substrate-binding protein n=1 Tax=Sporanaerobium hydrogeniformans TaxID=3072179 RepID=A0AC61DCN7_9FIRM|nr:amino acid ABC transporter substrate-binding protein [Sporanaerobium hydrogeniformans]PHV70523.1 amino acid ABC transporter substrate-binding protein [Sporanaerobium hydrogeniformans]